MTRWQLQGMDSCRNSPFYTLFQKLKLLGFVCKNTIQIITGIYIFRSCQRLKVTNDLDGGHCPKGKHSLMLQTHFLFYFKTVCPHCFGLLNESLNSLPSNNGPRPTSTQECTFKTIFRLQHIYCQCQHIVKHIFNFFFFQLY